MAFNRSSVSIVIVSGVLFIADPSQLAYILPRSNATAANRLFTFQSSTQSDVYDGPPAKVPVRIGELRLFVG
jgi:hypothetical protein